MKNIKELIGYILSQDIAVPSTYRLTQKMSDYEANLIIS